MENILRDKIVYVNEMMKRFKLVDIREQFLDIISEAEDSKMTYLDFLVELLTIEEQGKNNRREEKLVHEANFDKMSTLEDIDYSFNHSLDRNVIEELGRLNFIDAAENVIIIGPPGVGKTMIATGIGRKACNAGKHVLFVNAKELVDKLYNEMLNGNLNNVLEELNKIDLLIVDELSYIKMDREKESLFFQIIRQRYEKRSLVITTNLPLGRWNELFTGQLAATAILDRIMHHCHVISITGDSYRVKGKK